MTIDKAVFALAGTIVLLSLTLGYFVHPAWLLLAVFAGANMLQAAFTGFCPAARIFKSLGVKPGQAFD